MRCKLGDLAFVNQAIRPNNVGLIVECKEYLGYYLKNDFVEMNKKFYSAPISDNYWMIFHRHGMIETHHDHSTIAYVPDLWLTPIIPPENTSETLQENELETV